MRKFMLVLLSLLPFVSAMADDITVDGTKRNYIVYAPSNLGTKRPLLISCHGMNQDAAYQKGMLQIESVADTAKFVTVFPNGIDRSWDLGGQRDLNFMRALIEEMVKRYDIDRNKIYLSGFSMGGMFTYYAMNRMADVFAAFAPISGYPMWGASFTSSRPVPIIHTHGTSDDVVAFSGVANVLAGWVKRNGCPATAKTTKPYRAPHITRHVWGPGLEGVEVVLLEMSGKGHWISNDNGVKTGEEIWNFCNRFSLEDTSPRVRLTSPAGPLSFVTVGGAGQAPDITLEAEADDPDGTVAGVAYYDNGKLVGETTEPPYTFVLEGLGKGEHVIAAVATDNDGYTGRAETTVSVTEVLRGSFALTTFDREGCVPEGWETFDGQEHRVGYVDGFSQGSRVFLFTGAQHDFDAGLYTRNVTGGAKEGYARFAGESTNTAMTLISGNYTLYVKVANWNQPSFSPVTVAVEDLEGGSVLSETFTPTANIGNAASNSFSGTTAMSFSFDVLQPGRYVVSFYTADAPWADLVVGRATLRRNGEASVSLPSASAQPVKKEYFNLAGQRVTPDTHGIVVEKTVMSNGTHVSRVVAK